MQPHLKKNSPAATDAKETGRMSSEQDKDLVAKKNACCMQSTQSGERSDHISFRAESIFLKIALRSLSPKCPLVIC